MIEKIKIIINDWDPLQLLPYAPADEYNLEIKEISEFLENPKHNDIKILGEEIYRIFLESLGSDVFKENLDTCFNIASKILKH